VSTYTNEDRKTVYRLHRKGWGYLKISQVIGCSPSTVRKWILQKGIEPREASGHSDDTKKAAMDEYVKRTDLSLDKVAKRHSVGPAALSRWLHDAGIPVRPTRPRIISREAIVADLEAGLKKEDIARRNNCSESWVYRIQRGGA
jgi:transposase-like protein